MSIDSVGVHAVNAAAAAVNNVYAVAAAVNAVATAVQPLRCMCKSLLHLLMCLHLCVRHWVMV